MSTLFLCGAGNCEGVRLAQRVQRQQGAWDRILLLDDDVRRHGEDVLGVPIVGTLAKLAEAQPGDLAVNLVAKNTAVRAQVRKRIEAHGVPLVSLVHPDVDATGCRLGAGVLIYEHAILSPATVVGAGSVVFMRAVVGHDATVGEDCIVAAGAVLNARVVLESGVYVGANASIVPDVVVGRGATIGANSLAAATVPAGASLLGVPGVVLATVGDAQAEAPLVCVPGAADAADRFEERAVHLLRRVLGRDDVGAADNFFDVGGNSLRALQFLAGLRDELGVELPVTVLFGAGTVQKLAAHLRGAGAGAVAEAARERVKNRRARLWQP